ncbi:hypothetical protein [Variovorax sp. DAIF25]|uniref:hypothetical protein n=1 Tax=Variovorax sp. DAIF25 TaxID=3080983 RepID=UPI003D6C3E57
MSITRCMAGAILALAPLAASAQTTDPAAVPAIDGAWNALLKAPNGREYRADLNLERGAGIWQLAIRSTADPCVGLPTPARWTPAEGQGFELSLHPSQALVGCGDSTISFKPVDARTYQGRSRNGFDITLTRR